VGRWNQDHTRPEGLYVSVSHESRKRPGRRGEVFDTWAGVKGGEGTTCMLEPLDKKIGGDGGNGGKTAAEENWNQK